MLRTRPALTPERKTGPGRPRLGPCWSDEGIQARLASLLAEGLLPALSLSEPSSPSIPPSGCFSLPMSLALLPSPFCVLNHYRECAHSSGVTQSGLHGTGSRWHIGGECVGWGAGSAGVCPSQDGSYCCPHAGHCPLALPLPWSHLSTGVCSGKEVGPPTEPGPGAEWGLQPSGGRLGPTELLWFP